MDKPILFQEADASKTISFRPEDVEIVTHEGKKIILSFKSGNDVTLSPKDFNEFEELFYNIFYPEQVKNV